MDAPCTTSMGNAACGGKQVICGKTVYTSKCVAINHICCTFSPFAVRLYQVPFAETQNCFFIFPNLVTENKTPDFHLRKRKSAAYFLSAILEAILDFSKTHKVGKIFCHSKCCTVRAIPVIFKYKIHFSAFSINVV